MNVLSIDFDIIMAPSINLYNEMVPKVKWEELLNTLPNLTTTPADLRHYSRICQWLFENIKSNTDFYVAYSHGKILDFLKNDDDLIITNIDHHHDLSYDKKDKCEKGTCANWVKYLYEQNQLKRYIWVNNSNSRPYIGEELNLPIEIIDFKEFHFNLYDKIFLCLSPEWVPPYYHQLFYLILDILNNKNNYKLILN